jgi:DNA-binding beta-propeller fold protein YncE
MASARPGSRRLLARLVLTAVVVGCVSLVAAPAHAVGGDLTQKDTPAGCISDTGTGGACADGRALDGADAVVVSPDGKNAYAVSVFGDALVVFDRAADGTLTQKAGTAGCVSETGTGGQCADGVALDGAASVAVSPDGKNVYVASNTSDGLAVFDRAANGSVTQKSGTAGCVSETGSGGLCAHGVALDGARSVVVSPDGGNVYLVADISGAVAIFDRAGNGTLTQKSGTAGCVSDTGTGGACVDGVALNTAYSVAVSPDGANVYVASKVSAAVTVFDRSGQGSLTQKASPAACVAETGGGVCADGLALKSASGVTVSPDGKNVYVASNISNAVAVFDRASNGSLTQKAGAAGCIGFDISLGCSLGGRGLGGAVSIVISPDGRSAYVAGSFDTIVALDRSADGTLVGKSGVRCISETGVPVCADGTALVIPIAIAISPDGANVYVASFTSDAVDVFDRLTDFTGPVTSIVLSPAGPDGTGGVYVSPVDVSVSSDDSSASVLCVLDPATVPTSYDDLPFDVCAIGSVGADGSHVVYAAATDENGNVGALVHASFTIDRTVPVTSILLVGDGGAGGLFTSAVSVFPSTDDAGATLRCALDPATAPSDYAYLPGGPCAVGTVGTDGDHVVYAASIDAAGNQSRMARVSFTVDRRAPATSIVLNPTDPDGAGGVYVSPVGVSASSDDSSATVHCVLDPAVAPTGFADLPNEPCAIGTVSAEGDHVVYAGSIDPAGNAGALESVSFSLDLTVPVTSIALDPAVPNGSGGAYVSAVGVSVATDDPSATLRCVLDPSVAPTGYFQLPNVPCAIGLVGADGAHVIYAVSRDPAGNQSRVAQVSFVVDRTAPATSITLDPADPDGVGGVYVSPVGVSASSDDPSATVRCVVDPAVAPTGFADLPDAACAIGTVSADGSHTVYAASIDPAGNAGPLEAVSFRLDLTAPVTSIVLDPADPDGRGGVHVTPVGVSVSSDDSSATVRCVLDPGVAPTGYADLPDAPCAVGSVSGDGKHVVYAASIDPAGKASALDSASFVIASPAPPTEPPPTASPPPTAPSAGPGAGGTLGPGAPRVNPEPGLAFSGAAVASVLAAGALSILVGSILIGAILLVTARRRRRRGLVS